MTDPRPTLLIVSFSDIANDARVKKQLLLFAEHYRVLSCGFGEQLRDDIPHIRLDSSESRFVRYLEAILLRLRWYRLTYWLHPWVRRTRRALRGRSFDAAIANDLDTLGVVLRIVGDERTHAELHEYFPGLYDQVPAWNRLRRPYLQWQLRAHATRAASVTTVSDTIAERYRAEFGFDSEVVRNAAPMQQLEPGPVSSPLRIVHSGGAQANRRIEVMMEAVARTDLDATLDLYLTQQGTPYADGLAKLAEELGERIRLHPPVPQAELVGVLNGYDVGIHVLPPTNTNNALALPNKFFDYVQARLGIVIGPTADMAKLVRQYEVGAVAEGFGVDDVVRTLDRIDPEQVAEWKRNAHAHAEEASAERQEQAWRDAIAALVNKADQ